MKQSVRFILFVTSMLALLVIGAGAQEQEPGAKKRAADDVKMMEKLKMELAIPLDVKVLEVMGAKLAFDMKVVKGAPYSAIAETEFFQPLADGNRIRNKNTTTVYRDSEGRTRRESGRKAQGVATEVFINDPTTGVNYVLDTQQRLAAKSPNKLDLEIMEKKMKVEAEVMKQQEMKQQARASGQVIQVEVAGVPKKSIGVGSGVGAGGGAIRAEGEGLPMKKRRPNTESLGQQVIEGVLCEGRRTTITIPAGEVGNELPLTIVNEQWYSPELQVYVMTRQSDPRSGETIYRLTNINRSEPDRALFEVPSDYTIKDEYELKARRARKPEEQ